MKSDIRTFVLHAGAAASKRPMVTTEPNRKQMFRFKTPHLLLLLGVKFVFSFYTLSAL